MAITNRKMTENPVVQRIVGLIVSQGKMDKDLAKYLGLTPGSISKWKYDGSTVYLKHIEEICEFLETTPNYLFLGTEDESLTSVEKELLRRYRSLDNERKNWIRAALRYVSNEEK